MTSPVEQFVTRQNIVRYQAMLGKETDEVARRTIARLLIEAERAFALTSAAHEGVGRAGLFFLQGLPGAAHRYLSHFREELAESGQSYLVLDPGPGLRILDASEAYASVTMTTRACLVGRRLFEVFPDNPSDPSADGVAHLYASLRTAAETGQPHAMAIQRYDVRDGEGRFVERHWRPVNTPLLDDDGTVVALLHHVEDVTHDVRSAAAPP